MLRRGLISVLLGAALAETRLDRLLDPSRGVALLLNVRTRRLIAINGAGLAGKTLLPPGSAIKPFVLSALLRSRKLTPDASFMCPARLTIGSRRFDCTHPRVVTAMRVDTALAYSCNCFVAHAAEQFVPGELARELGALGFASRTGLTGSDEVSGRIEPAMNPDTQRMQALGEAGILVTPLELSLAYRQIALGTNLPERQSILAGLEGAVEFGTAQQARVTGETVAGKTGSARSSEGDSIAWFAGFMPSRAPQVVVTVMLAGRSGGSDAAPIAAQILEAYRGGRL